MSAGLSYKTPSRRDEIASTYSLVYSAARHFSVSAAVSAALCWPLFSAWHAAAAEDPWAKLEDSPSMTCLDNEAELNRIWIDNGDLYWSDYGNVSAICRQMNSGDAEPADGNECVVSRRDSSSQQWYFKIAIKDSSSSMKVENFFDFDIGQWDLITEVYGFQERTTLPCW